MGQKVRESEAAYGGDFFSCEIESLCNLVTFNIGSRCFPDINLLSKVHGKGRCANA